ncbi:RDD family protein [Pseudoalteromonas sp. SR44-5]|uniref:RDD family protein n=1 Tax=Pseudoalteromonas TaxID=53246 RepID=UPI00123134E5|nr:MULTISPECIES: RDD family protein [Pseudoalteromonas]MBB1333766.1 RDD family protein [Pseudoalteromonas sp. SR41-6]MBB1343291.1 RDD family protein [Pseudoalteromonas sp. SR45-6]MBB1366581.1 RDD family protein [Pseudoalteromonas sp. SR44-5]MBB1422349.1 RDD family protein [Pseudoalteromonas sp. SG43-7]MBB1459487.1 RDD family protein [Pseudoalteromonas sp. SG41-8]
MKAKQIEQLALTAAETKEVITPYAFKIDQALLGLPLASPTRRALAMVIDVALIFLAAKISAAVIAFVAAMAFYKGTAQKYLPTMSTVWRRVLKITAASILFISSLSVLAIAIDFFEDDTAIQGIRIKRETPLNAEEKQQINTYLMQTAPSQNCDQACQSNALANLVTQVPQLAEIDESDNDQVARLLLKVMVEADEQTSAPEDAPVKAAPVNSILQWGKGIIQDLGLGFGWAAVYFTLFSLLWRGQTPGKKVCNIRVVALSGEDLSLWDAFGRYGGYGAGFATGLLGFLQVYWDPNRQAIQDKISATVVIKGSINQLINEETVKAIVK